MSKIDWKNQIWTGKIFGQTKIIGEPFYETKIYNGRKIKVLFLRCKCLCEFGLERNIAFYKLHNKPNLVCKYCQLKFLKSKKGINLNAKTNKNSTNHYLYYIWGTIKNNCLNKKCKRYNDYGGQGIKIAINWQNSSSEFIEYIIENLGNRPSSKHCLSRIKNNGNYEPGNLYWATHSEIIKNQRYIGLKFQLKSENTELKSRIQQLEHAFMTKMLCKPAEI